MKSEAVGMKTIAFASLLPTLDDKYLVNYNASQYFNAILNKGPARTPHEYQRYREKMDNERSKTMRSLQDLALESCVTKFERVFLAWSETGKKICRHGRDDWLPSGMFEAIIQKAIEIEQYLTPDHLKPCLVARWQLNWINVDLQYLTSYGNGGLLDEQDLEDMIGNLAPLRTLRFSTRGMTESMLVRLSQIAPGLQMLIIGNHDDYSYDWARFFNCQMSASESYQVRFEKLKRLELNFKSVPMSLLESTFFAQNLQVLKLNSFNLSQDIFPDREKVDYFSSLLEEVVKQCKKLRVFDFLNGYLSNIEGMIGALHSLSDVQSISIVELRSEYESRCYRLDLSSLCGFLPKLETFKISGSLYPRQNVDDYREFGVDYLGCGLIRSDVLNMHAVCRRGHGVKTNCGDFELAVSIDSVATFGRID